MGLFLVVGLAAVLAAVTMVVIEVSSPPQPTDSAVEVGGVIETVVHRDWGDRVAVFVGLLSALLGAVAVLFAARAVDQAQRQHQRSILEGQRTRLFEGTTSFPQLLVEVRALYDRVQPMLAADPGPVEAELRLSASSAVRGLDAHIRHVMLTVPEDWETADVLTSAQAVTEHLLLLIDGTAPNGFPTGDVLPAMPQHSGGAVADFTAALQDQQETAALLTGNSDTEAQAALGMLLVLEEVARQLLMHVRAAITAPQR